MRRTEGRKWMYILILTLNIKVECVRQSGSGIIIIIVAFIKYRRFLKVEYWMAVEFVRRCRSGLQNYTRVSYNGGRGDRRGEEETGGGEGGGVVEACIVLSDFMQSGRRTSLFLSFFLPSPIVVMKLPSHFRVKDLEMYYSC